MTYKEAYDKIIDAYFKDEIQPMNSEFCFCGNLCNKNDYWNFGNYRTYYGYTPQEFRNMEYALFEGMSDVVVTGADTKIWHPKYEQALFNGMCKALEFLKQIHISRGEIIDELPEFTQRKLNSDTNHERSVATEVK